MPLVKEEKKLQEHFHDMFSTILNAQESAAYDAKALKKYDKLQIKRISLERQLLAIRAKNYAAEQEMLQDIVKKADVVRRIWVYSTIIKLKVLYRYALHVSRPHALLLTFWTSRLCFWMRLQCLRNQHL